MVVATVAAVAVLVVVLAIRDGSLVISSCCTASISYRHAEHGTTHMPAADGQNPALLEYTTLRLRELCDKRAWIVLYFAGVFCPPVVPWYLLHLHPSTATFKSTTLQSGDPNDPVAVALIFGNCAR